MRLEILTYALYLWFWGMIVSITISNPTITLLNLGQIPNVNTSVFIQVEKQNGAQLIQAFTSEADGTVKLDLSDPDTHFYNHFDGLYMVWVTLGGYLCDGDI